MQQITTQTYLNTFSGHNLYQIAIDGTSIEHKLLALYPGEIRLGLVPTLLSWLSDPEEVKELWERVEKVYSETTLLPILMCSEDCDFWCEIIMIEARANEDFVFWDKIGRESSNATIPAEMGKKVNWFPSFGGWKFDRKQYETVMETFRAQLALPSYVAYPPKPGEKVEPYSFS